MLKLLAFGRYVVDGGFCRVEPNGSRQILLLGALGSLWSPNSCKGLFFFGLGLFFWCFFVFVLFFAPKKGANVELPFGLISWPHSFFYLLERSIFVPFHPIRLLFADVFQENQGTKGMQK